MDVIMGQKSFRVGER